MWLTSLLVAIMVLLLTAAVLQWTEGKAWVRTEVRVRNDGSLCADLPAATSPLTAYELFDGPEKKNGSETVSEPASPAAEDAVEKMITERKKERSERSAGFCPKCGQPIQQSDQFCPGCGAKVGR